jgi:hypothetical protein
MMDVMKRKDDFPLKNGISRRSYFRGMSEEERDRARWQLYKKHAQVRPEIEPVYHAADLATELEALPPTARRLMGQVAEHLPDPPKPTAKEYPRYDARRLRDPGKLRRSLKMPRYKMYEAKRRVEDELRELARCKQYAMEQGLDYADSVPYTTPKRINKLAYLLERKRDKQRPTMFVKRPHSLAFWFGSTTITWLTGRLDWGIYREEPLKSVNHTMLGLREMVERTAKASTDVETDWPMAA